jgi:hypothetical protein
VIGGEQCVVPKRLDPLGKADEFCPRREPEDVGGEPEPAVRNYFDAGATEVMFTQTNLLGEETRLRTWRLLGELADR